MKHLSRPGALTKLTPETQKVILAAIERHAPYEVAAMSAGISEKTFYNWLTRGKDDRDNDSDTEFSQFLISLEKLEAEKIMQRLDAIAAGDARWQAHMSILEKRWRKFFGQEAGIIDELIKKYEALQDKIIKLHEARN